MNADGSAQRLLFKSWSEVAPDWSPDGRYIIMQHAVDTLYIVDVLKADQGTGEAGRSGRVGCPMGNECKEPAWSPDGSRVAFAGKQDGDWDIYVQSMSQDGSGGDGSAPIRLTNGPSNDYYPTWSPDSKRIAFSSDRDGPPHIYVMNADGSDVTRLTSGDHWDREPAWSPDGEQIAFTSLRSTDSQSEGAAATASSTAVLPTPTVTAKPHAEPVTERSATATLTVPPPPSPSFLWWVVPIALLALVGLPWILPWLKDRFGRPTGQETSERSKREEDRKTPPTLVFVEPEIRPERPALPPSGFRLVVAYRLGSHPIDPGSLRIECHPAVPRGPCAGCPARAQPVSTPTSPSRTPLPTARPSSRPRIGDEAGQTSTPARDRLYRRRPGPRCLPAPGLGRRAGSRQGQKGPMAETHWREHLGGTRSRPHLPRLALAAHLLGPRAARARGGRRPGPRLDPPGRRLAHPGHRARPEPARRSSSPTVGFSPAMGCLPWCTSPRRASAWSRAGCCLTSRSRPGRTIFACSRPTSLAMPARSIWCLARSRSPLWIARTESSRLRL